MTEPIYERSRQMMEAALGDELVTLDPDRGECFGFNSVATRVWQLLETPRSRAALEDVLVEEFDVERGQCASELSELIDDLVTRGLIRRAG